VKGFVQLLTSWGPWGVLILAALDSAGIPLPAAVDALVTAIAAVDPPSAFLGAASAVIGSTAGSMFLYSLGRKGGEAYLDRLTAAGRAASFRTWFQRYGLVTVFIPALLIIPLPLKIPILCAGALGVRPGTFLLVILAARVPRYFGLAWLGYELGSHSTAWLKEHAPHMSAFALALAVFLFALIKLSERRHRRAAGSV